MKITIENKVNSEIEVVIKGDASSNKIKSLVELLNNFDSERVSSVVVGKKDEREYVLPVKEIECFESKDAYAVVKHNNEDYKVRIRLFEAEDMYECYGFRRISKGIILNCNHIKYIEVEFSGNYRVVTKSGAKSTISRRYVSGVKKYIREEM